MDGGADRNKQEFARLREYMNRGFMLVEKHISALVRRGLNG